MKYDEFPAANESTPIVMFWHGGSWKGGSKKTYRFVGKALQKMGAQAVIMEYPVFPEQTFPGFIDDCRLAVKLIKEKYPDRPLFVMGHSAGAHLAIITTMTDSTGFIKGCVAVATPCTINKHYYRDIFDDALKNNMQDPRSYASQIPAGAKFCLIHGRRDRIVSIKDSYGLQKMLEENGVSSQLLISKFSGHLAILPAIFLGFSPKIKRQLRQFLFK